MGSKQNEILMRPVIGRENSTPVLCCKPHFLSFPSPPPKKGVLIVTLMWEHFCHLKGIWAKHQFLAARGSPGPPSGAVLMKVAFISFADDYPDQVEGCAKGHRSRNEIGRATSAQGCKHVPCLGTSSWGSPLSWGDGCTLKVVPLTQAPASAVVFGCTSAWFTYLHCHAVLPWRVDKQGKAGAAPAGFPQPATENPSVPRKAWKTRTSNKPWREWVWDHNPLFSRLWCYVHLALNLQIPPKDFIMPRAPLSVQCCLFSPAGLPWGAVSGAQHTSVLLSAIAGSSVTWTRRGRSPFVPPEAIAAQVSWNPACLGRLDMVWRYCPGILGAVVQFSSPVNKNPLLPSTHTAPLPHHAPLAWGFVCF